jgi:hypothetical protein
VRFLARSRALRKESIVESPLAALLGAGFEVVVAGDAVGTGFVLVAADAAVRRAGLRTSHGKTGLLTATG